MFCHRDAQLFTSEIDQEMKQSQTTDQPTALWEWDAEYWQSHGNKNTTEAKQPALFSSARWLQNYE